MVKQSLLRELFQFALREKKWWLIPLLVLLVVIGGLIIFAQSSAIAPFFIRLSERAESENHVWCMSAVQTTRSGWSAWVPA